ncbi:hypothetical protein TIFTF001_006372 [Ficus carica]|uniref:Uncharacterized protein n=1 Tax=Ficus carica TaxID=3494 RepID=A0AA88CYM9_FICCA|nr:hypothetical protein TIFTF001_006372 [Ficus carica]
MGEMREKRPRSRGSKEGLSRRWTAKEDKILTEYIKIHGEGQWNYLPQKADFISNPKPSNYDHESIEEKNQNQTEKQQSLCEEPQPSQSESDETTSIPSPEEAPEELWGDPVAALSGDVYGVVQYEHFETILSPVMTLEENYCQLLHEDVWMDLRYGTIFPDQQF